MESTYIAILASLQVILLFLMGWMRATMSHMVRRILFLESEVSQCLKERVLDQHAIGLMQGELEELRHIIGKHHG